jgi:hypothetical protein
MDTQPNPQNPGFTGEQQPGVKPEVASGLGAETSVPQYEQAPAQGAAVPTQGVVPPAVNPAQASSQSVAGVTPTASPARSVSSGPATAADVDVIEPEWVDKAESVVQQHQGDPYGEEEAVEDLQRDYLKKRYGHDVADANSDSSKPGVS